MSTTRENSIYHIGDPPTQDHATPLHLSKVSNTYTMYIVYTLHVHVHSPPQANPNNHYGAAELM